MPSGLLELPWWGTLSVLLGFTHITIIAVTVYLHRHQAHRAIDLHPGVAQFFRFWLWLTTGMVTREWVAVHRKHHAHCETADDPHSPQIKGLASVLLRGTALYRREAARPEVLARYGKGTPDDTIERWLYSRYKGGVVLMLLLDIVLLGPIGIVVWAVQMVWIPFWAAGIINGLGHHWGYRNYDTPDASTNIAPWGVLIGGEELHNNHHAYPGSAKMALRPFEFDLGWFYIRLLARVGLAHVRRVAPAPARPGAGHSPPLDVEAVHAIAKHRLRVLGAFAREVTARVHRTESRRVRSDRRLRWLFRRARKPLLRPDARHEAQSEQVSQVLAHSDHLRTVCEFRRRLQGVWRRAGGGQEAMRQALQQWCREAESSGVEALQRFARRLASYRLCEAR